MRYICAVLVFLGAAAGAWGADAGTLTVDTEPGYAVTSQVDWTAGVVNVEITRTLDPTIPSLVEAKGDAETDVETRLSDLLLRAAGAVTLDSSHTFDDVLGGDPALYARVSALAQAARRTALFLSSDFSSLVERFAVPLFGDQGIAQPLFPAQATPIRSLLGEVTTRKYTGLLIDARGLLPESGTTRAAQLQPAVFPRIWDEQMNLVLDKAGCDPDSLAKWGVVGYARNLDDNIVVLRAGVLPLRLVARAVFGTRQTDAVISLDGARQLLALPDNRELLKQGHVVILY
jgi:hypothetical protein